MPYSVCNLLFCTDPNASEVIQVANPMNVERLFALPFFQQMFEKMFEPLASSLGQNFYLNNEVDPALIPKVTDVAFKYIYQGMTKIIIDSMTKNLTDDEVDFLRLAYQHPGFLKMQDQMQSMIPEMNTWLEENQKLILDSIATELSKAR